MKHCWMSPLPEIEGVVELVLHKVLGCRSPGPSSRVPHFAQFLELAFADRGIFVFIYFKIKSKISDLNLKKLKNARSI